MQRGLASFDSQMFGSHSKYENCLFSPALRTPPRPVTSAASSPLPGGANGKHTSVEQTAQRGKERVAEAIEEKSVLNWEEMLRSDGPFSTLPSRLETPKNL